MAIRDLLWACPLCATVDGLRPERRGERCTVCRTTFTRGPAARIRAVRTDGETEEHDAPVWARQVGAPSLERVETGPDGTTLRGPATVREALVDTPIRAGGELLGWREQYGPSFGALVRLGPGGLVLARPGDAGSERRWPLDDIAALGASSTSLQVRPRGVGVLKIKLLESSLRLWEETFQLLLRERWREAGRGEIVEFIPRITVA